MRAVIRFDSRGRTPTLLAAMLGLMAAWPVQAQYFTSTGANSSYPTNLFPIDPNAPILDFGINTAGIGNSAPGSFSALAGSLLKAGGLQIGNGGNGNGSVVVTGSGATVQLGATTSNRLDVGSWGTGTLTVSGGGVVDATVNAGNCSAGSFCNSFVGNAAGSMVYLYKMPGDNPVAWVTPAIVKASDEQALGTVLDARFDVRTVALFDSASHVATAALSALPTPLAITAAATRWEPGHITLALSGPAPAGSALMVSENFYPGWRALVDGQAVTPERADLSLIGVPLPSGATKVELEFRSDAVATGKHLTLVGLLLGLGWLAAGIAMDRRTRRG